MRRLCMMISDKLIAIIFLNINFTLGLMEIRRLSKQSSILGEGPVYDEVNNILYWVDIEGFKINYIDFENNKEKDIKLNDYVTSLQLTESKNTVVVTMRYGFYYLDIEEMYLTKIAEIEKNADIRFNDGKCDYLGRYWAGTMDLNEKRPLGSLYRLNLDYKVTKHLDGLTISNGIAWSLDNKEMYLIDSIPGKVYSFKFNNGEINDGKIIIDFSREDGVPDGMTIDEEGMLWIAHYGGGKVSRWDPNKGRKIQEIKLPTLLVTSCTFGGDDLNSLFITTARRGLNDNNAGYVYEVRDLGIRGVKGYRFKGLSRDKFPSLI
jgi:sugar lactone lactonase YvrE